MNLFCLLHGQDPLLGSLRKCLGAVIQGARVEYFFTLKSLLTRLGDPACFDQAVILVAADAKTLDDILEQGQVLTGLPMVLLVDHENESNLSKGHLLQPRFITGLPSDPQPIKEVLRNLLRLQREKNLPAAL